MCDKLDQIWESGNDPKVMEKMVDRQKVANKLKLKKKERVKVNRQQAQVYNALLQSLTIRKINLTSN